VRTADGYVSGGGHTGTGIAFMTSPNSSKPVKPGPVATAKKEITPVIERSADPVQLLANILTVAGDLAAQWGEEILLHIRVAAVWSRIGYKGRSLDYLKGLTVLHQANTFNLGWVETNWRYDMMRYFLSLIGLDDLQLFEKEKPKTQQNAFTKLMFWKKPDAKRVIRKVDDGVKVTLTSLSEEEEQMVKEIVRPRTTWLENTYLTNTPGDTKALIVGALKEIKEYSDPDVVEQQVIKLLELCRGWHERKSDTPIWVHDLDDVGPRVVYLAVMAERPFLIIKYILLCIDALNERPLALIPNVATAIAGLGYYAKRHRSDDLLQRALDFLPRLPEHERCISAITLVEVLVERS